MAEQYDWVYMDLTSDHDLEILQLLNIDVPDAYYPEGVEAKRKEVSELVKPQPIAIGCGDKM